MLKKTITFLLLLFHFSVLAQRFTISGYVEDAASGERMVGAVVYDQLTKANAVTNTFGFYSLTLPSSEVEMTASFVGFTPQIVRFSLKSDTVLNFGLKNQSNLETVEINAQRQDRVDNRLQMSQVTLPIEQIKKVPALLGETDILKTLQLLPGIKFGSEGTSGLYVRGGGSDQNLILLDGVPVYNASHIGGLFSVFNADAIKNVRITTGGFPARFGGRLSSVVEIDMKEGNLKKWQAEGGVGVISSRLLLEGPIWKDKISCMVSARRTYADVLLKPGLKSELQARQIRLDDYDFYFYDLNAKINWKINDKNRIYWSAYTGYDRFGQAESRFSNASLKGNIEYKNATYNSWGNLTSALRWNFIPTNKFFINTSLLRSNYFFEVSSSSENPIFDTGGGRTGRFSKSGFDYLSKIEDLTLRSDAEWLPNAYQTLRFGLIGTAQAFSPGVYDRSDVFPSPQNFNNLIQKDTTYGNRKIDARTFSFYTEYAFKWRKLTANLGFHGAIYAAENRTIPTLQPRLNFNYRVGNTASWKASFVTMTQFVNLLTNDGLGFPVDLWVPTSAQLEPQRAWQAALGYAKSLGENYEMTVETYYKSMKNVISYREGAAYIEEIDLTPWEQKVTQGTGEAYGLEFFLRKTQGKWTGWASYTLAWNNRQFSDINNGEPFPFRYDRRHELALVGNYQINKNISLSGNFVFATANPITPPEAVVFIPILNPSTREVVASTSRIVYGKRNSFRPNLYHRLDMGIDFVRKRTRYERKWSIGVFNAYNRANPFYYDVATNSNIPIGNEPIFTRFSFQKVSLIPILPSISYSLKWIR